jgi:hypothetical protein
VRGEPGQGALHDSAAGVDGEAALVGGFPAGWGTSNYVPIQRITLSVRVAVARSAFIGQYSSRTFSFGVCAGRKSLRAAGRLEAAQINRSIKAGEAHRAAAGGLSAVSF